MGLLLLLLLLLLLRLRLRLLLLLLLPYLPMSGCLVFREYVRILSLLPAPGRVLDVSELRGYAVELRKLMLGNLEMSNDDLLIAFNRAYHLCFVVVPKDILSRLMKSIRHDITDWVDEARMCRSGPLLTLPPLDESKARIGG